MSRGALLIGLLLCAAPALAGDDWGPWEAPQRKPAAADRDENYAPLTAAVRFFQRYISPVDGPRCRMHPTCSAYALQALDRHGPWLGTALAVDRLLHEGDPREHRRPLRIGGRLRFHDPVENSDFWLADR